MFADKFIVCEDHHDEADNQCHQIDDVHCKRTCEKSGHHNADAREQREYRVVVSSDNTGTDQEHDCGIDHYVDLFRPIPSAFLLFFQGFTSSFSQAL